MSNIGILESAVQLIARISSNNRPSLQNLLPEILPRHGPKQQELIEICGESNVGKTIQLMEMIAQTVLPTIYGGKGAQAVVIDTNSNFSVPLLLASILEKHILHRMTVDSTKDTEDLRATTECAMEHVHTAMKNVWIFTCYSNESLDAILASTVEDLLRSKPLVSLIAFDSIDSFYWSETSKIRMETFLRQRLRTLRSINQIYRTVLVYTRPAHFGAKSEENADYCIELTKIDDGEHFQAICSYREADISATLSRCYEINDHGVRWLSSSDLKNKNLLAAK